MYGKYLYKEMCIKIIIKKFLKPDKKKVLLCAINVCYNSQFSIRRKKRYIIM